MCTMVAQSYTRIRQLINFFFPFVSSKRFHSPEYKVGIASYPCLSSCSTGTLKFRGPRRFILRRIPKFLHQKLYNAADSSG